MKSLKILALTVSVMTILSACSTSGGEKVTPKSSSPATQAPAVTTSTQLQPVKISSAVPLTGSIQGMGKSFSTGAELAVADNVEKFKKLGVDLQFSKADDKADPKEGAKVAAQLVADKDTLAMIGPFNSGVARESMPVYEAANLAVISPGASAVDLTSSGWKTFHRINAKDDVQGSAGAKYAKDKLGLKNMYVVSDNTVYGNGLAKVFEETSSTIGLKVSPIKVLTDEKTTDFGAIVDEVLKGGYDGVYFAGMYPQSGPFVKDLSTKGYKGGFLSGDGSDAKEFLDLAGASNLTNVYVTGLAGDVTLSSDGKDWTDKYVAKFKEQPGTYSVYGYDAVMVVLNALEGHLKTSGGKTPTREEMNVAIGKTSNFQGVLNKVTFDAKGDNKFADVYIYSYADGKYPGKTVGVVSSQN